MEDKQNKKLENDWTQNKTINPKLKDILFHPTLRQTILKKSLTQNQNIINLFQQNNLRR